MTRRRITASTADWWLAEKRRSYAAMGVTMAVVLPAMLLRPGMLIHDRSSAWHVAIMVLVLAVYLVTYVALTLALFAVVPPERSRAWAASTDAGTMTDRLLGYRPGAGLAATAAGIALAGVVVGNEAEFWQIGLTAPEGTVVLGVLLVTSWVTVALTYAVEYFGHDKRTGGTQLDFPGEDEPGWVDYLYFSLGVSTTFGTTDVGIRTTAMRRTVTGHSIVAFVFNTVVLAVAINALA